MLSFQSACGCLTAAIDLKAVVRGYSLQGFHSRYQQVSALSLQVFSFLDFCHFHLCCFQVSSRFCSLRERINITPSPESSPCFPTGRCRKVTLILSRCTLSKVLHHKQSPLSLISRFSTCLINKLLYRVENLSLGFILIIF